jgi:hypothetical protein
MKEKLGTKTRSAYRNPNKILGFIYIHLIALRIERKCIQNVVVYNVGRNYICADIGLTEVLI